MGYAFVALCLFSSTIVLTTACGDDEENLEYKEENPEEGNGPNKPSGMIGEAIDLGLSVMWASHNVGATKPEDYGDYFAWGETTPKSDYSWDTYKYGARHELTKYCIDSDFFGTVDNKTMLELSDDAATVNWGSGWRMPTSEEIIELSTNCTWTWKTQNGVGGQLVTGPNGNSIFLPAAGYRYGTSLDDAGSYGWYWSSSLNLDYPPHADLIYFNSGDYGRHNSGRLHGHTVRPVRASTKK